MTAIHIMVFTVHYILFFVDRADVVLFGEWNYFVLNTLEIFFMRLTEDSTGGTKIFAVFATNCAGGVVYIFHSFEKIFGIGRVY